MKSTRSITLFEAALLEKNWLKAERVARTGMNTALVEEGEESLDFSHWRLHLGYVWHRMGSHEAAFEMVRSVRHPQLEAQKRSILGLLLATFGDVDAARLWCDPNFVSL
jgi:hypothetical protein